MKKILRLIRNFTSRKTQSIPVQLPLLLPVSFPKKNDAHNQQTAPDKSITQSIGYSTSKIINCHKI